MTDEDSVLVERARAAERAGDYAAAFDVWQRLAFLTNRPDYLCKLGRVAERLGRWKDAEKAFLDAIEVDQTFWLATTLLGSLFLARTDGDLLTNARAAKAWLEKSLVVTMSPMSLTLLGAAHGRLGEKERARDAFRKVIELDECYEEAYFNLGLLLAQDSQNEEAEMLLRTATRLNPTHHQAHGRLGILLQEIGRHSEAEVELRRAVEIDPTDTVASFYLNRATTSH